MAETPSYRVMSVDPKQGDIDEQFALIETQRGFGAPASDPSMRRIVVGDSLPEGEVTAITGEGIQVIPDEGDEYVIPLGGREGYKPPVREKPTSIQQSRDEYNARFLARIEKAMSDGFNDRIKAVWSGDEDAMSALRQQRIDEAREQQGKFFDPDDAIDPDEVSELVGSQFQRSFDDDKTLEMTQTPEGMRYLFQDDDGNISSYFQDEVTGEVVRTTPEPATIAMYNSPSEAASVLEEALNTVGINPYY